MRKRLMRFSQVLATLAVVGGLAFGVRTALAERRDPCQPCFSQEECEDCCFREYGTTGVCFLAQQACLCL